MPGDANNLWRRWGIQKTKEKEKEKVKETIFKSPATVELLERTEIAALSNAPAFITGESGTGKEHIAKLLHTEGKRSSHPFIAVNCAALSSHLIESELFGSRRGSYTGSIENRVGLFREAGEGTIFLDELSEMPIDFQSKLLRAIQDKEVRGVGDSDFNPINCRIVAATNRPVQESINQSKLRKDLYYRLAVITLHLPPLRERPEDIEALAIHFIKKFSKEEDKEVAYDPALIEHLKKLTWDGNVRQLENAIHRAIIFNCSGKLSHRDFADEISAQPLEAATTMEDVEKRHIINTLKQFKGVRALTADALKISRGTLYEKMKRYQI